MSLDDQGCVTAGRSTTDTVASKSLDYEHSVLHALLSPRSIAVIGASDKPGKWGSRPIRYLQKFGYQGDIYPVNPKYQTVMGLPCYRQISDLPVAVDLALVALPANTVGAIIKELGERKVKSAAIFSSGFAEVGVQGERLQQALIRVANDSGIRFCGPNCLGIINIPERIAAATSSALELDQLIYEPISIISQSGAIGLAAIFNRAHDHGIGFSRMVSTGNEADLELADFIDFMIEDSATKVIAFYAEGFRDGRRLLAAFDRALLAGKPVIGLMTGLTQVGRNTTASHTGLLADSGNLIQGSFRQFGVVPARDLDDIYEKAAVFSRCQAGGGRNIAIVTTSGGIASLLADLCADVKLDFPEFEESTQSRLKELLPPFNPVNNPLDISGQFAGDAQLIFACLQLVMQDPSVESCILVLTIMRYEPLVELLLQEHFQPDKPLLILFTGGSLSSSSIAILEQSQRFPVFWRADKCVEALSDLNNYRELRAQRLGGPGKPDLWELQRYPGADQTGTLQTLSEKESRTLLERSGIIVPKEKVVHTLDEVISAASDIGFPVALKLHGATFAHKTEIAGVRLDLRSEDELSETFRELESICVAHEVPCEVLVQEMVRDGVEVFVGLVVKPRLGPVLSLGPGGIFLGLLGKPSFRVAPLTDRDVLNMIRESGLLPVLSGHRGDSSYDIEALIEVVLNLSKLSFEDTGLTEVDINPLIVRKSGCGALAVDSLVVKRLAFLPREERVA